MVMWSDDQTSSVCFQEPVLVKVNPKLWGRGGGGYSFIFQSYINSLSLTENFMAVQ